MFLARSLLSSSPGLRAFEDDRDVCRASSLVLELADGFTIVQDGHGRNPSGDEHRGRDTEGP